MRRLWLAALSALAVGMVLGLQPLGPAVASNSPQDRLVSEVPSGATPNILNGMTETMTEVGSQIIAGGSFTSVAPPGSTSGVARSHVVAFDSTTGQINPNFDPTIDGTVMSVEPGPATGTVYVAGNFSTVNGTERRGIALLDTNNGQLVTGFDPASVRSGFVKAVRLVGDRLYLAGNFNKVGGQPHFGLATLDPTTGALDPYMDLQLDGHHNYEGQPGQAKAGVGAVAMDVNADGSAMVVIGNFTTISGQPRDQIAVVTLGGATATVDQQWATQAYTARCFDWAFDTYMRAVNFSPDGSYFVVSATGGSGTNDDGTNSSCDTAARYETNASGSDLRPTWITYTGQDTLTSVAVTGAAVYVGGHERWMNNSKGHDAAAEGAVPRPGLAALNPKTGVPYSWNPGRNPRGVGTHALLATDEGLYAGYDTEFIGNREYRRERVAMFPLAGGEAVPTPVPQSLPANTYTAAPLSGASGQSGVFYRVNAGGPAIAALDNGPDWMADQSDSDPGSQYRNTGSSAAPWSSGANETSEVPASTPNAIFNSERWDGGAKDDGNEMHWTFPVPSGTPIQVRLYFANRYSGTSQPGQRVFDVALDGQTVLDDYDIVADVGDQTGTMKSFDISSDGDVNIDFSHEVENPLVDGIEIVKQDAQAETTSAPLLQRSFDGATVGTTETVPTDGIDWATVRGGFVVGERFFYGSTDGYLHERSFDAAGFGPDVRVDPYDDPEWSDVATGSGQTYRGAKPDLYSQFNSVTGMFFDHGRLYYTKLGDSGLYSRWFEPESGIMGSDIVRTTGGDFESIAGMFYADGAIYYADRSSGELKRVDFDGSTIDGSSVSTVSGPAKDGNSWSARALFLGSQAQQPNKPPVAAFEWSCSDNVCTVDASGSSDPDGEVTSYAWDFGDGSTGIGQVQSHAYSTAGDFSVTLTVTDNDGATDTETHQLSPAAPPEGHIAFVGAAHSGDGAALSKSVAIPDGTQPGDVMLLFLTKHADTTWSGLGSGWNSVGSVVNGSISSSLWVKTASASDPGSAVTLNTDHYSKADISIGVYSGVDATQVTAAHASDSRTSIHVTPMLAVNAGDLVVSYWADKSSSTTEWTTPKSVTVRDIDIGTGSGRFSQVLADSDTAVAGGSYGGLTATTNEPSGKAIMWTVAMPPGSTPTNQSPVAGFTASCEQNVCAMDASGSTDTDGSVVSYSWVYGDGSTGTGETASHAYSAAGQYSVKLTVTDNDGATTSVTHQVSPAAPPDAAVLYVGESHSGTGAERSKHVDVPAAARVGDTMVLLFTRASDTTWSAPGAGWTPRGSFTNHSIESTVWTKEVTADDLGATVELDAGRYTKGALVLSVYSGADGDNAVVAHAGDSRTTRHVTPEITAAAGDVVLSFWSDKSSSTTQWTAPTGVAVRGTAVGSGSGRYSFLLADSGTGVATDGTYGNLTATTDATSGKGAMWTVALPRTVQATTQAQEK